MDDADHIINVAEIYRETGKPLLYNEFGDLVPAKFHVEGNHAILWHHDLFHYPVVEVKNILDQFILTGFYGATFFAFGKDKTKFFFCVKLLFADLADSENMEHQVGG